MTQPRSDVLHISTDTPIETVNKHKKVKVDYSPVDEVSVNSCSTIPEQISDFKQAFAILSQLRFKRHKNFYLMPGIKDKDIQNSEVSKYYFTISQL